MSNFFQAFTAYQSFDPAGWVAAFLHLPLWAAIVCIGVGAALLAAGSGATFRLIAAPLGLATGLLWTGPTMIGFGVEHPPQLAAMVGLGLMLLGLAFPSGLLFFALGLPLGVTGGKIAGPADFVLGFAPGFLLGGVIGAAAHRTVGAVLSSILGGWMLTLGLLALAAPFGGFAHRAAAHPWLVLGFAGLLAVGGGFYQIFMRPSPEEAEKLRREKLREAQRLAEKAELERRWGGKI